MSTPPPDGSPFNLPRWTEREAREVIAALEGSGKSVRAFAAEHGLDPQRVYAWRRRLGGAEPTTFREVIVQPHAPLTVRSEQASFEIALASRRRRPRTAVVRCRDVGSSARGLGAGPRVLSLPPSVRLFVATQPVDGRKGPDSLMALVRDVLRHDPLSGHLFIFFSKRCDRVRVVYWDRNGYAMWTKRLEKGAVSPDLLQRQPLVVGCHRGRGVGPDRRRDRAGRRASSTPVAARRAVAVRNRRVREFPFGRCVEATDRWLRATGSPPPSHRISTRSVRGCRR